MQTMTRVSPDTCVADRSQAPVVVHVTPCAYYALPPAGQARWVARVPMHITFPGPFAMPGRACYSAGYPAARRSRLPTIFAGQRRTVTLSWRTPCFTTVNEPGFARDIAERPYRQPARYLPRNPRHGNAGTW